MRGRGLLAALGAALLAAGTAGVVLAAPASAHTTVTPAAPSPGETVTDGPVTVAVTATDAILEAGDKSLVVQGPDGLYYGDGCVTVSEGRTLSSDIVLGDPGEYTVIWTLVAADGHQQSSTEFEPFTFDWEPADGQDTAEGSATAPSCDGDADTGDGSSAGTDDGAVPTASASSGTSDDAASYASGAAVSASDLIWLGAGAVVVLAALVSVLVIAGRRGKGPARTETGAGDADDDASGPKGPRG